MRLWVWLVRLIFWMGWKPGEVDLMDIELRESGLFGTDGFHINGDIARGFKHGGMAFDARLGFYGGGLPVSDQQDFHASNSDGRTR